MCSGLRRSPLRRRDDLPADDAVGAPNEFGRVREVSRQAGNGTEPVSVNPGTTIRARHAGGGLDDRRDREVLSSISDLEVARDLVRCRVLLILTTHVFFSPLWTPLQKLPPRVL